MPVKLITLTKYQNWFSKKVVEKDDTYVYWCYGKIADARVEIVTFFLERGDTWKQDNYVTWFKHRCNIECKSSNSNYNTQEDQAIDICANNNQIIVIIVIAFQIYCEFF